MLRSSIFAATLLLSCCAVPQSRSLSIARISRDDVIARSDVIVLGSIESIAFLGRPRQLDDGYWVQQWRLGLRVHCAIRGEVSRRLSFAGYYYAPGYPQNGDLEWLAKGETRFFFLHRNGGLLRPVQDYYRSSIDYPYGFPAGLPPRGDLGTAQWIAEILLTPPAALAPHKAAGGLARALPSAVYLAGYAFVAQRLAILQESAVPEVRAESCLLSYDQMFGSSACLAALRTMQPSLLTPTRVASAERRRAYLRTLAEAAVRQRARCPLLGYAPANDEKSPNMRKEFLEYLSRSDDGVFRACAAGDLKGK